MSPEEIKRMRQINFKQTNAFAMQNGLILGAVGIATLAAFIAGQSLPLFGSLHLLLLLCTPLLAVWLTARFRLPSFPLKKVRGRVLGRKMTSYSTKYDIISEQI